MSDTATLSSEEFQRLQNALLQLRESNYNLTDQVSKKDREINVLQKTVQQLDGDLQKARKEGNKRQKSFGNAVETDSENLREKLAAQEEEFRLQQATLLGELQRVLAQQEELEKQVGQLQNTENSGSDVDSQKLLDENTRLQRIVDEQEKQLLAYKSKTSTEVSAGATSDASRRLNVYEDEIKSLKVSLVDIQRDKQTLTEAKDEEEKKIIALQQELNDVKEQLRRKQASYVQLSEQKDKQYEEYRKSLDSVVQKKDGEIGRFIEEVNGLKRQLQILKESESLWTVEKNSLDSELFKLQHDLRKVNEEHEMLEVRLQETISAGDCLSNQLQETRAEVERMQKELDETNLVAAKRKELVDEMNVHIERLKEESKRKEDALTSQYALETEKLQKHLCEHEKKIAEYDSLTQTIQTLQAAMSEGEEHRMKLESELKSSKTKFELCHVQQEELIETQAKQIAEQKENFERNVEAVRKGFDGKLKQAYVERDDGLQMLQQLKQEIKDREDAIKAVERKYQSVIKDLKRQLLSEKQRSDRLQEKLQEINSETRNKSPGNTSYEEIRHAELAEQRLQTAVDAASVSSWSMVSGKDRKESDKRSVHTADHDSESSVTILESDNQELMTKVAELQRKNSELYERIDFLEETNGGMADDLVKKTAIIEHFLKEKPVSHSSVASPERLAPVLKKMIDLVKIDQSAHEIRDMNKRLQLILEETLTKNIHLQEDLELMSQEVARLSHCDKNGVSAL